MSKSTPAQRRDAEKALRAMARTLNAVYVIAECFPATTPDDDDLFVLTWSGSGLVDDERAVEGRTLDDAFIEALYIDLNETPPPF